METQTHIICLFKRYLKFSKTAKKVKELAENC